MATLSDLIEEYIRASLEKSEGESICLKRGELSSMFSCVPSQINYVINTRFTINQGFLVESKRGEGGYLRVIKLPIGETRVYLEKIKEESGTFLSWDTTKVFLEHLVEENILSGREKNLIWQLVRDESLPYGKEEKGIIRGKMIQNLIGYLVGEKREE